MSDEELRDFKKELESMWRKWEAEMVVMTYDKGFKGLNVEVIYPID
jgi:hypothetical protein